MGVKHCFSLLLSLSVTTYLLTATDNPLPQEEPLKKNHILYLVRSNRIPAAIDSYKQYKTTLGHHDSEILEQIALILLDQAMASHQEENELISLYGASLAGVNSLLDLCELGMKSHHPNTQLVALQMAGNIQDDRANDLLCKAFSSDFLGIRMEAAGYLAHKKYRHAVGYIESLMHKLPPFFHCFFPRFYAQIGSAEAVNILKKMLHDTELYTRVSAILAIAQYGRDDLIKEIRTAATHLNPAEQEACAFALGALGDSHSIQALEVMAKSSEPQVQLAAYKALANLGKREYLNQIKELAKHRDLFAIECLAQIETSEDILFALTKSKDKAIRFNAALGLLKHRDPRCTSAILEMLLSKQHDLGFTPHASQGKSMMHWKIISSASAYGSNDRGKEMLAISLALREQVLLDCLELEQTHFLSIANELLKAQQKDLIPLLMHLLCNMNNPVVIELLKAKAEELGSPFIRNYASLALYKLKVEG
ncbi:MAG: HEAT repeat domain-containing protein, partial [Chlamydiota bacterium]